MRITVVDPPAYTPPYDHSLCAALARRGHEVELVTSRFRHAGTPEAAGYKRIERFYRRGSSRAAKAAQHPLDMLALAARLRGERPAAVHFQWLPIPALDRTLLRRFPQPLVVTAHELPTRGSRRRRRAIRSALDAADAVVVHTEHGRERLVAGLGLPSERVHVIPHGALDYLTRLPREEPLDPAAGELEGRKVVLSFGLVRPYKGIDVLIEAFASAPESAVLLVVGRAMTPIEPLRRRAAELGLGDRVRFISRFVSDAELPAFFRRADLVVLPYRDVEQSGVLFTAMAFGRPLLVSAVGGFVEIGERHGAARLVQPGSGGALGRALADLLENDEARLALAAAARRAAEGPYSWERVAELTERLYLELAERRA